MRFSKLNSYVPVLSACRARVFIRATHRLHRAPNSQLFHAFSISRDSKDISSRSLFSSRISSTFSILYRLSSVSCGALAGYTHVQHQLSTPSPLSLCRCTVHSPRATCSNMRTGQNRYRAFIFDYDKRCLVCRQVNLFVICFLAFVLFLHPLYLF